jgi:16S rRNA (cytosine1402-N4)-methyltransferase
MKTIHRPVMLDESIENLNIKSNGVYVDCTLGGAGHSIEIYKRLDSKGHLICIDQDEEAIIYSKKRFETIEKKAKLTFINSNFKDIKSILKNNSIDKVDGILADLGVSSFQLDTDYRGFSYNKNANLDMRMNKNSNITAKDVVNNYKKEDLLKIIREYGEERWAKRIAEFIIKARSEKSIVTTFELVDIIKKAIPASARREGPHPAKRTFQAIRIEVNDELNVIKNTIKDMTDVLNPDCRVCIITFHSLEDRIVKSEFNKLKNPCTCPNDFPICVCKKEQILKNTKKKALNPSDSEIKENHRARSARLRIAEKI